MVFETAPKFTYVGPVETKVLVELGPMLFNVGFSTCFEEAYEDIGVTVSKNMLAHWECAHSERITNETTKVRPGSSKNVRN